MSGEYFGDYIDKNPGGSGWNPPSMAGQAGKFWKCNATEDNVDFEALNGAMVIENANNPAITDWNYNNGTIWINTTTKDSFQLVDNTTDLAIWRRLTSDMVFDYEFYMDGQNQYADVLVIDFPVPYTGYFTGFGVKLDQQRTLGTLDLKLAVNGSAIAATGLNLQLNGSILLDQNKTIDYGTSGYLVNAGQHVGVMVAASSFQPLANKGSVTIIIKR